ncbi:Acetyl-CoA acetyltransferase [Rhizobiales bacterium GAS191]|nr:Acetyl-CoA acetyltransferase [Rhizobiales bacterium GAS191]
MRTVVDGVGHTGPVRRSPRDLEELALEAIDIALADAGLDPRDVEAVVTESTLCPAVTPLDRIGPAARLTGLRRTAHSTPVGAGILAAIGMAVDMVERGEVETALTWFATGWGSAKAGPTEYHAKMQPKHLIEDPVGFSGPPLYFAVAAKRYQHVYGLSDAEMETMLFDITSAARANAALNPNAQVRKLLDRAGYAASPMIAEPLHQADCSLLSDGAAALVISRRDRITRARPEAGLRAWAYAVDPISDADFYTQSPWLPNLPAAERSAAEAFARASLSPSDIDVLEIYDCFSIAVAMQLEAGGFCEKGGTALLAKDGGFRHDGRLPVNTHGGLVAHGYLLGVSHAVEAVTQLRGAAGERQVAGARRAYVGAGPGRQYTSLILERVDP